MKIKMGTIPTSPTVKPGDVFACPSPVEPAYLLVVATSGTRCVTLSICSDGSIVKSGDIAEEDLIGNYSKVGRASLNKLEVEWF